MATREFTANASIPHGHHQNWDLMEMIIQELERVTNQWPEAETVISVQGKRGLSDSYESLLDAKIELGDDVRDVTEVDISRSEWDSDDSDRYVSVTLGKSQKDRPWVYATGPVKRNCEELVRGLQQFILQAINSPESARKDSTGLSGLESRLQHLHPVIKSGALSRLESGHGDDAIEEACKSVGERLRKLSGLDDDGTSLVGDTLSRKGVIAINDGVTRSDVNEQEGYMHLGMALYQAARNPRAHRPSGVNFDSDEVIEWLSVASALHRALDKATRARRA